MSKRNRKQVARRRGTPRSANARKAQASVQRYRDFLLSAPPEEIARALLQKAGDEPVPAEAAGEIEEVAGLDRAREIADVALLFDRGPAALSLATDVALASEEYAAAERHAVRALQLLDHPDLRLRLAAAKAGQIRIPETVEAVAPILVKDPLREDALFFHNAGLELLWTLEHDPPEECGCGSGKPYARCCGIAGRRLLDDYRDRGQLLELREVVYRHALSRPQLKAALERVREIGQDGQTYDWEWPRTAGPDDLDGARRALLLEQAWLMPEVAEDVTILDAFAESDEASPEQARRARDWSSMALHGFWLMRDRSGSPGMILVECLTGLELYVEVPPELEGLPRWSVLFGAVGPVDGVLRCGAAMSMTLAEAHVVIQFLMGAWAKLFDEIGAKRSPEARWLRKVRHEFETIRMPDLVTSPSPEVSEKIARLAAVFTPKVVQAVETIREHRMDILDLEPAMGEVLGPLVGSDEDMADEDVEEWFQQWPDRPLEVLAERTPRHAAAQDNHRGWVETCIRLIEHEADSREVELDTEGIRKELGLVDTDEDSEDDS